MLYVHNGRGDLAQSWREQQAATQNKGHILPAGRVLTKGMGKEDEWGNPRACTEAWSKDREEP